MERLIGLIGLICIGVAAVGLVRSSGWWGGSDVAPKVALEAAPKVVPEPRVMPSSRAVLVPEVEPEVKSDSFYPLEVGRYWVYVRQDPATGVVTEVERRIVRRESRPGQDLFFFSDETMAFEQEGRVFEAGPEGGVNVVPLAVAADAEPYVYRSQGLYIEKEIGTRDTAVVLDGRRFSGCMQVITRFRREDRPETLSYASYYARGVGMVGREAWPRGEGDGTTVVLKDYGARGL